MIFFFVDDIVALFKPQHQTKFADFTAKLKDRYKLQDLGELKWFLGICVVRDYTEKKKNSSQNHVLQGPSFLTNTTICHMFWKTAEFLSETTQTLR